MKRNNELLTALNSLLVEKLTTINQLMAHSGICEKLGYSNLHKAIQKQAMDQMLLAEWLINRISFLESSASISVPNKVRVGKTVSELTGKNESDELDEFQSYSNAIELAAKVNYKETVEVLSKILLNEKEHVRLLQNKKNETNRTEMVNYLLNNLGNLVN